MKVFVINLDKDAQKLASMQTQLDRLGVEYTRIPAVYGKQMSEKAQRSAYDSFRWWCAIGRKIEPAEIGCALSHYGLYKEMSLGDKGSVCCILEDDIQLTESFPNALAEVEKWIGVDLPRVVMLSDRIGQFAGENIERPAIKPVCFAYCTDAYVLNAKAAAALLRENYPLQRPCDHWAKWVKRGAIELYHYLPTVASQDQETFGTSTQGGLQMVRDYPLPKWIWHKAKRAVGRTIDALLG